jgi:hypothetical protein
VTSRRCLGMCWMRSSRPSLSADCVWQPQGAPTHPPVHPPLPPLTTVHWNSPTRTLPPPSPHAETHNHMKQCGFDLPSIALFMSPQIRKKFSFIKPRLHSVSFFLSLHPPFCALKLVTQHLMFYRLVAHTHSLLVHFRFCFLPSWFSKTLPAQLPRHLSVSISILSLWLFPVLSHISSTLLAFRVCGGHVM